MNIHRLDYRHCNDCRLLEYKQHAVKLHEVSEEEFNILGYKLSCEAVDDKIDTTLISVH